MKSSTTQRFWKCYDTLPKEVRKQAKGAYELFSRNPYYPSLHFKRIHATKPIFSVRINIDYRAVGFLEENEITWFWIGSQREHFFPLGKDLLRTLCPPSAVAATEDGRL